MGRGYFKTGVPCLVEGCDRPAFGRGWCRNHWHRWRNHGHPLAGFTAKGARPAWIEAHKNHTGDDCLFWPYSAPGDRSVVYIDKQRTSASRAMCMAAWGAPPSRAHEAAHSCGNGHLDCMNPRHLRWATKSENQADRVKHGTHQLGSRNAQAKLNEDDVLQIRRLASTTRQSEIARLYRMSRPQICVIVSRKSWAWL